MTFAFDDLPRGWRTARFDQILSRVERKIQLDDSIAYDCAGVRWYGLGAFKRETLFGFQIKRKQQWILRAGDVVYNKLFAWKSAFAIADSEVDGCIVSDKFPTYAADASVVDLHYLGWYFRMPQLAQEAMNLSKGAAAISKLTLNPPQFWELTIPLPPLEEQRRIVARIEALAGRLAEARGLRQAAMEEAQALWASKLRVIWSEEATWEVRQLGQLTVAVSGQIDPQVEPYASLPHINGESMEAGTCRLLPNYHLAKDDGVTSGKYHFEAGAILYSKIRPYLMKSIQVPFEGICSADVYSFESFDASVFPRFFMYSLISPRFTQYANDISGRTRMPKVNQDQLYAFPVRLPPMRQQMGIVAQLDQLQAQLGDLRQVQSQGGAELVALLPSLLDKAFRGEL